MKTALFLGAGASVFAGHPTTQELLERLRRRVEAREDGSYGDMEYVRRIIEDPAYSDIETLYGGMAQVIGINENPYCKPIIRETGNHMTAFDKITHNLTGLRSTIRQVLLESFDTDPRFPDDIKNMYDSVWEVMKNNGTDEFRVFTRLYA